jgi:energy-coupling factor transporter ATP-binding protein EcfA2
MVGDWNRDDYNIYDEGYDDAEEKREKLKQQKGNNQMSFTIKKAERFNAKLRIGLFGASGSGKTTSALLLAQGLVGDLSKVVVIDTERGSADLYAHLGDYSTLSLEPPYSPERYIQALKECQNAGFEAIIVDSITHEWNGKGGCLEIHESMTGNSYTNWSKVTPRHNAFIDAVLDAKAHVICCGRVKDDVVLSLNDKGKQAPEKVGLKAITRDGFDYEMTLCFDIDAKHNATSSKDRTELFDKTPAFIITPETGAVLKQWANSGKEKLKPIRTQSQLVDEVRTLWEVMQFTPESFIELTGIAGKEVVNLNSEELELLLDKMKGN